MSGNFASGVSSSTVGLVVIRFIIRIIAVLAPAFCFKCAATNAETQDKTKERNGTEDPEGKGFSLRLNFRRQGEETARQERANGTSGSRQCLRETIKSAQNSMIRSGIGNLING